MKPIHQFLEQGASIEIGEFIIREQKDGTFYLERESGDGVIVQADELEELLFDFYKEHF